MFAGSCYANLPPEFKGKFIFLYPYDSYDITPFLRIDGTWEQDPYKGGQGYQLAYSLDWTSPDEEAARRTDPPNQLKYPRTLPLDKTLLTSCNYHVTTAKADRCPAIFASGTAKTITFKHMAERGWDVANGPYPD